MVFFPEIHGPDQILRKISYMLTMGHPTKYLIRTPQKNSRSEKQGKTKKLSQMRGEYKEMTTNAILNWKKNINRKTTLMLISQFW